MTARAPCLVWVDSKEPISEHGDVSALLDQLLVIPGERRISKNLLYIRGNILRGRNLNRDTLNIWYLDADPEMIPSDITNQSLHGTIPTLVGATLGEYIWKGPLVAVMKVGNTWDPRLLMDITLTGYRDAIDFLGYYRELIGSMIDGIGIGDPLAKRVMADQSGKVWGVRINCIGDQARGNPELVPVAVPKTHPLFNLEGDDPLCIPDLLELTWVAKAYGGKAQSKNGDVQSDLENPLARLLLLQTSVEDGEWEGLQPWWRDPNIGSILVVDRRGGDVDIAKVKAMCNFIQQKVVPLMTAERATALGGEEEVLAAITEENLALFLES